MTIKKDDTKKKNMLASNKTRLSPKDNRSKVAGIVINSHMNTEEALRLQTEITNNMAEGIVLIRSRDAVIIYTNPRFEEMFGYGSGELIGKNIAIVNAPTHKSPEEIVGEIKKSLKKTGMWQGEVKNIKKDGTHFWCQANVSTYKYYDQEDVWISAHTDITKRKQAEGALKLSEQNFRNSMDSSTIGIRIMGDVDYTLYVNQTLLDMFGYKNIEELRTSPPQEHYTPESYVGFVDWHEKYLNGEPLPEQVEVDIIGKDSAVRHLQVSNKHVFWNGKQQFQLLYNDITDRVESEKALNLSEQNFRNSLDSSSIGIRIGDVERQTFYTNQAFLDIFGYENIDEVRANPVEEHYIPESYADYVLRKEKLLRGEPIPYNVEVDIKRKDGSIRHLQAFRKEVFWNGKQQFQLLYNDITERVRAEDSLKASEVGYRRLFESAKDGILIIDAITGTIIDVNPFLTDLLGLSFKEIKGREIWKIGIFNDMVSSKSRFQELFQNGHIHYGDLPLKSANGQQIWVELVGNVYDVVHRRVIQLNIYNITERKQAEKEKQELEAKAQVASRLAAVGEMAAGIAHEINNPLTGVLGFSQLLLRKENVPEDIKGGIRVIADGSQRVADIVKRLLTFARQTKPIKTLANLNELIENTLKLREYVLKTANINVITRFDPELPISVVDPGQLQQVFLNLIVNAEQAMKEVHGKGTLTITTEKKDNNIRISFQDDGPGITKENVGHLFEPFFTTKEPGEGTGLGLSLSRSIVLEHNGKMNVVSEFGHGATFIVEIPIIESLPSDVVTSILMAEVEPATIKNGKILVVDDEPGVRALMEKVLTQSGHSVDIIGDASKAMDKLNAGVTYDVILTDVRMPGMNGTEMYSHILKKIPKMKNRIIFITGDVMGADIKVFLTQNKLSYLSKPFDLELLKEKIEFIMMATQPENDSPDRSGK